ncbi:glycosyltransferase family 4 protein [Flavobacterium sp.]|jgi:glycosyltransferase involved in cell wall biosynthesis|uniref:glycosyltransferase family 4 protein n=1 Tax=Flavobacterium sp. TaxID=239 RepID=UPI00262DC3AF|nr:glycosyltransferase family 4 protein [Flavobacterium sp.]
MKVIYFTKYSRLGASSRLRSYQFEQKYHLNAIDVTYYPFFDDAYLEKLYQKKSNAFFKILYLYVRRFFQLVMVFKYDKVIIEKELFPYFPAFFEQLLSVLKIRYIVDYDDAIFHNYDCHSNTVVKKFLGNKIAKVMRYSGVVIVGNQYLKNYAQQAGAQQIIILPTVIDLNRYIIQPKNTSDTGRKIVIGWIGSPTTFKYFKVLENCIRILNQKHAIEWHIVGAEWADKPNDLDEIISKKWSEKSEIDFLNQMDIGIMPLLNTPWEQGKCAYKIIQYMALGIPVVASPVGKNCEVILHQKNGYLANDMNEWQFYLEQLITQKELRLTMGANGRKEVEKQYTIDHNFNILLDILKVNQYGNP